MNACPVCGSTMQVANRPIRVAYSRRRWWLFGALVYRERIVGAVVKCARNPRHEYLSLIEGSRAIPAEVFETPEARSAPTPNGAPMKPPQSAPTLDPLGVNWSGAGARRG